MRMLWASLFVIWFTILTPAQTRLDLTTPETAPPVTSYTLTEISLNLPSKLLVITLLRSDGTAKSITYHNACAPVAPATTCVGAFDRWMTVFASQKLGAAVLAEMQRRGDLAAGTIR